MKAEFQHLDRVYKKVEMLKMKYTTGMDQKVMRATVVLKAEVLKVIKEYNRGILKRDKLGKQYEQKPKEELLKRKHAPLIDEGLYVSNWHADIEKVNGRVIGKVFTNTFYAWWLEHGTENEDGSSRMEGYHVLGLAYVRARPKIRKILFGG